MQREGITASTDFVTAAELRDRDDPVEISIEIVRPLSPTSIGGIKTSSGDAQADREVVRCPECEREVTPQSGGERVPHTPECSVPQSEGQA